MRSGHRLSDGQAQARATRTPRTPVVGADEPVEDLGLQLLRHAGPVVLDQDFHLVVPFGEAYRHPGARRSMGAGVREQVGEHLLKSALIASEHHGLLGKLQYPAVFRPGGVGVAHRVEDQTGQVHRLGRQRASRVQPGEQQQVVNELTHAHGFAADPAEGAPHRVRHRLTAAQRQLRVPADRGHRGPQLMAGVGSEPAQPLLAGEPAGE